MTIALKTSPEANYTASTPLEHRKRLGQFFTPEPVAHLLARWVAEHPGPAKVLDPAAGTGALLRAIKDYCPDSNFTGYDIDARIIGWARKEHSDADLRCADFLTHDWDERYDGIIANPPYLKFHDYDNLPLIRHVEERAGVKLTGFTNLYALFIIKALHQLRPDGRAAFIVPSEFLNSDYGVAVKKYLLDSGMLRHVVVVHFEEAVFADALTTACILLFGPANEASKGVTFSNLTTIDALEAWTPDAAPQSLPLSALNPAQKWRRHYAEDMTCTAAARYGPLVPFATVGKVSRGIATGANHYFVFTRSKTRQWGLDLAASLKPCISRATDVPGAFFTDADFGRLAAADRPVYLLDTGATPDAAAALYLAEGERQGIPAKHLPASRKPWHRPERRPPAPIWVTVFNRGGLRFVRNETQTLNLTTFHCVYLNLFWQDKIDLVMAYLLTDIARQIFADNRREYGNGLEKFEPNDLNGAMMLDLERLDAGTVAEIVGLYRGYREGFIMRNRDDAMVGEIDGLFRDNFIAGT